MERKIGFIVIFTILVILIISNVFCIATIRRINRGLTQSLEEGKGEIEVRIDPLIKFREEATKEINKQKERNLVITQEIKERLSKLEQRIGMGKEKGAESMREIEKRLDTLERHEDDRARSGGPERIREIEKNLSKLEQRMNLQAGEQKQIGRRLDGLERHEGDQERRNTESIREIERRLRELERGISELD